MLHFRSKQSDCGSVSRIVFNTIFARADTLKTDGTLLENLERGIQYGDIY